eukprot:1162051-Pelagomonas_calceolata.AAC.13
MSEIHRPISLHYIGVWISVEGLMPAQESGDAHAKQAMCDRVGAINVSRIAGEGRVLSVSMCGCSSKGVVQGVEQALDRGESVEAVSANTPAAGPQKRS